MRELDEDRELGLEALTRAYTTDVISVSEFERRAALIQQASDGAAIRALLADFPQEEPRGRAVSRPSASGLARNADRPAPSRIDDRLSGSQSLTCVMGERSLQGDWLTGDHVHNYTLMGSTRIDLRDLALPPEGLRFEIFVCMGEVVITVPRGLAVRLNATPFMGEVTANRDVRQSPVAGEPGVRIDGFVLMGSLKVVAAD